MMSSSSDWFSIGNETGFDARNARAVFTTLFLVVNFSIAFITGRLIRQKAQRLFLKNQHVPVKSLTPFLSLGSICSSIYSLRTIPGGWYGILMIVNGIFGIVNHYIVNFYVYQETQNHDCTFDTGILTTHAPDQLTPGPVPVWATAHLAFSAQHAVIQNCGVPGIYKMIPNNFTGFRPTDKDVLGNWVCTQMTDSIIQPADWVSRDTLMSFTQRQNFLYTNGSFTLTGAILPANNNSYISLMAWSANRAANSPGLYDVRATMSLPSNVGSNVLVPNNASNFECKLHKTVSKWVPPTMRSDETLDNWADTVVGSVQDLSPEEYGTQLSSILNAMWMISGSGNNHCHTVTEANSTGLAQTYEERTTYGCVITITVIKPQVFTILLVLMVALFILLVMDLYAFIRNRFNPNRKVADRLPIGLLEWQAEFVGKMIKNDILEPKEMLQYEFYLDDSIEHFGCRRIGENNTASYEPLDNPSNSGSNNASKSNIAVSQVEKGSAQSR